MQRYSLEDKNNQIATSSNVNFFAGIHWGKGGTMKHAYTGIKAARVVESLNKTYGLDVSSIHGFGFRW